MKRAAVYIRVSTEEQSVENQLQSIREYAARRDINIVETYQEEESAWRGGRQRELARLMRDAQRGRFLRECCDQDVKLRAMKLELHNAYCEWCKADGESWAGYKTFNQRMVERGYSDGQSGKIRYWKGIALHQLPGAT